MNFPKDKMWRYQGFYEQIAMELSYFNLYEAMGEAQKSFWIFAKILLKILYDPQKRIKIDEEKAQSFIDQYFGLNGNSIGLYALDIIERSVSEDLNTYIVVCRGVGKRQDKKPVVDPEEHHLLVMKFYKDMFPLMWYLWHDIASQIEESGINFPEVKWDVINKDEQMPLEDLRTQERIQHLVETGQIQQRPPLDLEGAVLLGGMEEEEEEAEEE